MDAPTRKSYRPVRERLDAYALEAPASAVADVADEVLGVAALLGEQPRLRRALVDPARSGNDRAGLVRSLLRGKVADATLELVEALVSARWSRPSSLRDAAERLGADAVLAGARRAGDLGEVEDELFRFAQVVEGAPQLAAVLGNPSAPVEHRAMIVDDLLAAKARPATVRLVRLALTGFGGRGFTASIARLVELAAASRNRQVAYVTAAVPLSDEDERRLGERLAQMYGRRVSVKVTVDPQVIGGLSVRIGSDLYDGTVLRRLTAARTALTK